MSLTLTGEHPHSPSPLPSLSKHLLCVQLVSRLPRPTSPQPQIPLPDHPLHLLLRPRIMPARLTLPQLGPHLVRADELPILVDNRATKAPLLDDDRRQHEPRTDLHQVDIRIFQSQLRLLGGSLLLLLRLGVFLRLLDFGNLVVAHPDLAVGHGEGHDVVDEGLGLARALRDAKGVQEELLDHFEVWLGLEGSVEGEDRAGALEAVAREMEFFHCVY